MNTNKLKNAVILIIFSSAVVFSVAPLIALAATPTCDAGRILPPCVCDGNCNADDFVVMFINLAEFFLGIVAILAMYYLVMGGFTLISAAGSPEKIQAGKNTIVNALTGLFVVFAAWVIINTLFFALAGKDEPIFGKEWWLLKRAPTEVSEDVVVIEPDECGDLQALANKYSVPYPAQDAPSLTALKACIASNVPNDMIDWAQVYTIDQDHPKCNYTRGEPVCDSCSHSYHSCHYGGAGGNEGANYNAKLNQYTEAQLFAAIEDALEGPCDGLAGYYVLEGNHTHISTPDCSGN